MKRRREGDGRDDSAAGGRDLSRPMLPKLWRLSLSRGFPQLAAVVTASFWLRLASEVAKRYDVHVLAGKGWIEEPVASGRLSTPGPLLYYPDTACCLL
jgi:hypothetical protein